MGCHFLPQGIFPARGSNLSLQHCRQALDRLSHQGSQFVCISHPLLDDKYDKMKGSAFKYLSAASTYYLTDSRRGGATDSAGAVITLRLSWAPTSSWPHSAVCVPRLRLTGCWTKDTFFSLFTWTSAQGSSQHCNWVPQSKPAQSRERACTQDRSHSPWHFRLEVASIPSALFYF